MSLKEIFQSYAEHQAARILTQMDRDPDSPTFGCFDRNYWHYKIRDFSSSILQQGLFTLEAIAKTSIPGFSSSGIPDSWRVGAMNALARQVDSSGRVDEYYPYEGSYPAAAFGLYAAGKVLWDWQQHRPDLAAQVDTDRLSLLANQLGSRMETEASNQQAAGLAGLAFAEKLGLLTNAKYTVREQADQLFRNLHPEGWFTEYGGPDFGYLTVTIDVLVDYYDMTGDGRSPEAIDRAVEFLAQLVGADNKLPSTLNSRNTDYVVPYGLVKTAHRNSLASWLVETLFEKLSQPSHFAWATDDRYHCHYIFASIVRSIEHIDKMSAAVEPEFRGKSVWLEGCGYQIYWSEDQSWNAYVGTKKGGLVRIHRRGGFPAIVDHGWRVKQENQIWTNNWWEQSWQITQENELLRIQGNCHKTKYHVPSPPKHFVLRVLSFLLREKVIPLLKRVMIFRPGMKDGTQFTRNISMTQTGLEIEDKFSPLTGAIAYPSPRQNLRHVASADSFSPEELTPSLLGDRQYNLDKKTVIYTQWKPDSKPQLSRQEP